MPAVEREHLRPQVPLARAKCKSGISANLGFSRRQFVIHWSLQMAKFDQTGTHSTPPRLPSIPTPPIRERSDGHAIPPPVPNVGPSREGPKPIGVPQPNPAGN